MTSTVRSVLLFSFFFFFNDTATTEIYTLSLHDALPIFGATAPDGFALERTDAPFPTTRIRPECAPDVTILCYGGDRKSTRLNSSHVAISYAVFCLKKKKK